MTLSVELDPLIDVTPALVHIAELGPDDPERTRLRDEVICRCAPAARREATRYRNSGEPMDDLYQVATIGLILAVDRYDATRGVPFKHFALPTIVGELKRHFRDTGWSVRVKRRLKELSYEVGRAEPLLAQRLGRTPSTRDIAAALNVTESDVLSARAASAAHFAWSLSKPVFGDDDGAELADTLGADDQGIAAVVDHETLRRALRMLPPRLAVVVSLRYLDDLSQTDIGSKIGCSQVHASRLLDRAMNILRQHMATADADPPTPTLARLGSHRASRRSVRVDHHRTRT
jgi:RNA polymerase sigma-B factor